MAVWRLPWVPESKALCAVTNQPRTDFAVCTLRPRIMDATLVRPQAVAEAGHKVWYKVHTAARKYKWPSLPAEGSVVSWRSRRKIAKNWDTILEMQGCKCATFALTNKRNVCSSSPGPHTLWPYERPAPPQKMSLQCGFGGADVSVCGWPIRFLRPFDCFIGLHCNRSGIV